MVFDLAAGGIDRAVAELAAGGATIVTPMSYAPGGWSAKFADPDAYVLSMYQSERQPRKSVSCEGVVLQKEIRQDTGLATLRLRDTRQ